MSAAPSLARDGDVHVLNLGDGENRFTPDWLGAVAALLDEVEALPAPRALVTTASGKFWSNGLDLDWMEANPEGVGAFVDQLHDLLAQALTLGLPTVAAIQGHAFAGGALLALTHDHRIMRADRGFVCLPEVDIRIPFSPGMTELLIARLPVWTSNEALTTGRRYGGVDAAAARIVDEAVAEEELLPRAIERAASLAGKDPATLATIKQRLYGRAAAALRDRAVNTLVQG
ncbi:enoyl-CoA hydratase-related protein [Patulibacter defluvii]|uniref:enoyl-CoA hydratase-related protein n=1 Tax=Patulibacter defluvii TaxID=3095358 RepID=UPI002A75AA17|nr:enoyl-CoA hydratase-related protein [Patulibacter sp. DM4]